MRRSSHGALEDLKKSSKIPKKKSKDEKAECKLELAACKMKSAAVFAEHAKAIGVCYDLFHQLLLLEDEPQVQWDRIIKEVQTRKTPGRDWMVLNGRDIA